MTAPLRALLARLDPVARVAPLSRMGDAPAYVVDLRDGRRVKARVFPTTVLAARVERLLRTTGNTDLPVPMVRVGRALAVEFVEGTTLDRLLPAAPAVEARLARETGALLARLHVASGPLAEPSRMAFYTTGLRRGIGKLARARLLDAAQARYLATLSPPRNGRRALTHGDLCPENLIMTPSGRLRAVDEERLAVRPIAFDLARTVSRWPLRTALEAELLTGYETAGGDARSFVTGRDFWLAAAFAISAEHRLSNDPRVLAGPLTGLRTLTEVIS